jgi:hypothetical protein
MSVNDNLNGGIEETKQVVGFVFVIHHPAADTLHNFTQKV